PLHDALPIFRGREHVRTRDRRFSPELRELARGVRMVIAEPPHADHARAEAADERLEGGGMRQACEEEHGASGELRLARDERALHWSSERQARELGRARQIAPRQPEQTAADAA